MRMVKRIIVSLFLMQSLGIAAQEMTIREAFKHMPDTIVPYLTENNRLDFVDFIDSNMEAEVTNSLGGKSKMLVMSGQYASILLNDAASLEMCLLPVAEPVDSASYIICLVRTYGTEIRESTVDFYSLQWRQLDRAAYLKWPDSDTFEARLDEQASSLTLQPVSYADAPASEEQKKLSKPSIILKWKDAFVNED